MTPRRPDGIRRAPRLQVSGGWDAPWRKWGPYLSERQWGTVREDYSQDGDAWQYFPHDHARSRAYPLGRGRPRGLFRSEAATVLRARALEREGPDPEGAAVRPEQRRGQPRRGREGVLLLPRFHADPLVHEVAVQVSAARLPVRRSRSDATRAARARTTSTSSSTPASSTTTATSTCSSSTRSRLRRSASFEITVANRGPEAATIHLLPTLWFRNTWSWWPEMREAPPGGGPGRNGASVVSASHPELGERWLYCDGAPPLLFTENDTNTERLFDTPNASPYVKDAFHAFVVHGNTDAVNPARGGHQGRCPLPPRGRCRPVGDGPALSHRCAAAEAAVCRLREDDRDQTSRGGRVLSILHAGVRQRGRRAGHAAGLRRPLLDEAVLLLRRQHVAARARRASVRLAGVGAGEEPPLVPHVQRRRHLDAGQVGVPVVRRVGPRLSRGRAGGVSIRTSPSINST